MFKRIGLFLMTNLLMVLGISIILSLLGVNGYLTAQGIDYQSLLIFCLVWGFVGSFISLMLSKFMAKQMMGVKIVDANGPYASLVNRIHTLARQANLPKMPEVGIYESPDINAFATGPSKSNSLVAVSTGLLSKMNDDEVEGVLAHEVAHIANGDMVTMALVQGVMNAFVMFFARIAAFALQQAMRKDDDESPIGGLSYYLTTIVFEMVFGFLSMFVVAYFSRIREYRADAGSAKLAGRDKMIKALRRLQQNYEQMASHQAQDNASLNAFKISTKSGVLALLSTHPSLESRIKALETGAR